MSYDREIEAFTQDNNDVDDGEPDNSRLDISQQMDIRRK